MNNDQGQAHSTDWVQLLRFRKYPRYPSVLVNINNVKLILEVSLHTKKCINQGQVLPDRTHMQAQAHTSNSIKQIYSNLVNKINILLYSKIFHILFWGYIFLSLPLPLHDPAIISLLSIFKPKWPNLSLSQAQLFGSFLTSTDLEYNQTILPQPY